MCDRYKGNFVLKKRILSVFGTRPEVIKMAPVIHALEASEKFESFICTTSQHRQMQDQMMQLFNLKADYDLNLMKPGQGLNYIASEVLAGVDKILENESFDMVLVQGDTTTTFAASLAAYYRRVPVGSIEAGLRTYDLEQPYPEEANRQLTSRIAKLHFAPTQQARENLLKEHVDPEQISVTGNTVIDALFYMQDKISKQKVSVMLPEVVQNIINTRKNYILITGHRRESFGPGFLQICQAIKQLAVKFPLWHFVYPVHLNPNVQNPVNEVLIGLDNVHLIGPVDYAPFVYLMDHCKIVLTDSGGVQEEAPSLGKPVLVMREVTERPEGIESGTAKIVGTNSSHIVSSVSELISSKSAYDKMANAVNPYGDGTASRVIIDVLERNLINEKICSFSKSIA